ncbi:MAG: hypothetical protein ABIK48_01595 [candidate division WOR-3 bacterium]
MRTCKILLMLIPALTVYCPRQSRIIRLSSSNPPPVITGYYPHYHQPLPPDHPLQPQISVLRHDIEANENLLRQLVRQRYDVKSPLEFRFSYAGLDSANRRLIIRYFAPDAQPHELAGWQVQFICRLPKLTLDSIYVWAVPLE